MRASQRKKVNELQSPVRFVALVAIAGLLVGCSAVSLPVHHACSGKAWIETALYFGLSKPGGGRVSAGEWQGFVEAEISPRFKEGFTMLDGRGAWAVNQQTEHEDSKVLIVLHPPSPSFTQAATEIAKAYVARFDQQAVMQVQKKACVAFVGE